MKLVQKHKSNILPVGSGYSVRPRKPTSILIHSTNNPRGNTSYASEERFLYEATNVSADYLVGVDQVTEFLDSAKYYAWHAGEVFDQTFSNQNSIGIEVHYSPADTKPVAQSTLDNLLELVRYLQKLYDIPSEKISLHRIQAKPKGRKSDPNFWTDQQFENWRKQLQPELLPFITIRSTVLLEAPEKGAKVALNGTAHIGSEEVFQGVDQRNGYIWHSSGIGFISAQDVNLYTTKFTEDSLIQVNDLDFDATPEQAIQYILSKPHAAEYTPHDIELIVRTIYDLCKKLKIRFVFAIALMLKETGNLSSALCKRRDKDGRNLRNPGGIGVYEPKEKATKYYREGCVWDSDVGGYRPAVQFKDWVKESCPALVGRIAAWNRTDQELTEEQRELVRYALSFRPLPDNLRGSAKTLKHLGKAHNPTGVGWASPGTAYGAGIAEIANAIMKVKAM